MRLMLISAAFAALMAAPASAQRAGDICPGLNTVLKAAAGAGGLASLATGTGPAGFAPANKPPGMSTAQECSVIRGAAGGRDQFDCRWQYVAEPDSKPATLSQKAKACLKGWKADAPEKERTATITRFSQGALEVLTVEVATSSVNHSDRLSISAPVK